MLRESVFLLLRCERGDNFLETRVATQRIPVRVKFEKTVAEGVRDAFNRRDLFNGAIFVTDPSVSLRQIHDQECTVDGIFGYGQQFARALTLLYRLLFSIKASIDHCQQTKSSREIGLLFHYFLDFCTCSGKGAPRFD